jgi:hypothetical protein
MRKGFVHGEAQFNIKQRSSILWLCPAYSISIFLLGDSQKTRSALTSSNMMPMMTSLVGNLVYSSLKTSFVDFTTSISPSFTNPAPSWISSSQNYSTLTNDTGIQTCISSVNTIYTCNSEKRQSSSRQFLQALLT